MQIYGSFIDLITKPTEIKGDVAEAKKNERYYEERFTNKLEKEKDEFAKTLISL